MPGAPDGWPARTSTKGRTLMAKAREERGARAEALRANVIKLAHARRHRGGVVGIHRLNDDSVEYRRT